MGINAFIFLEWHRDYRHHFDDIIAGALIGWFNAFIGYFVFFPSLFDERCDVPKDRHAKEESQASEIELKPFLMPFASRSDD